MALLVGAILEQMPLVLGSVRAPPEFSGGRALRPLKVLASEAVNGLELGSDPS